MALTEEEAARWDAYVQSKRDEALAPKERTGERECSGVGTVVEVEYDPDTGQAMVRCPSCPTWSYVDNITAWVPVHFRGPKVSHIPEWYRNADGTTSGGPSDA
jgi:hypothetical protein